jgi:uncharacterized membrane protein YfcA
VHFSAETYLILCPMLFLAAFVDSSAGGGGLISIPAYLFVGVPIHFTYGTNKFTSGMAALLSSSQYIRHGKVPGNATAVSAAGALVGAVAGARLALFLSDYVLRVILIFVLPAAAVFMLLNKNSLKASNKNDGLPDKKLYPRALLIGLLLGMYDGFFGPGTGTFLILAMTALLGYDLITACSSARVVNLVSNLASLFTFIAGGKVLWQLAVPGACCSVVGGYFGSKCTLKYGSKFVRPIIFIVIFLLLIKMIVGFVQGSSL